MEKSPILVINTGSSSLKFGLYTEHDGNERPFVQGEAEGIGRPGGKLELKDSAGQTILSEERRFTSQADAFNQAAEWLAANPANAPVAIGHRIVHGGPHLVSHQPITPGVLKELKAYVHFAPLHIPLALELVQAAEKRYPAVRQFACFDTAFHSTLPEVAARFPLPNDLFLEGVRRYGFHGLSYESILYQLGPNRPDRLVVAHLGNGASLAAIKNGRSVDTSMGLTPTGGIPMATRSGDLDPGVILYLLRLKRMNADSLEQLLNHESGLTALSGGKADMRDLQTASQQDDELAHLAIDVFCMSIRKFIAAYSAVLGGLDMIVFTGGIGEHSAQVRANVCGGLAFVGVRLDSARNNKPDRQISAEGSKIAVCVLTAEEDVQIARHCRAMMRGSANLKAHS
jgi:acetate kinase